MLNKEVQIKVYSKSGAFITTLQDTLISTSVSFDMQINSGVGRLSFNYHDDYLFNITDVIQVNDGQGRVIYRGRISNKKTSITPTGNIQTIEAQGMQTLLNSLYFSDGVVTDDPKNILQSIIDVYNTDAVFRRETDFVTYGASISVEFTNDTLLSAINKVLQNQSFYLYFGMDGVVTYTPTLIKDRVGTNNGTPTGAVTIDDGAMSFQTLTGTNEVALTDANIGLTNNNPMSLICRVNVGNREPDVSNAGNIVNIRPSVLRGIGIRVNYGSVTGEPVNVEFAMRSNAGFSNVSFSITGGIRYALCLTYDGTDMRSYVNGSLIDTRAGRDVETATGIFIGGQNARGGTLRQFMGLIQGVGFYNRTITQEEITQIYNAGRYSPSPVRTGLIAEYYHSNIAGKVEYKPYHTNLPAKIYDYVGSNIGTPEGGVTIDDGAMVFDGVDDYITAPSIPGIGVGTNTSVSVWVNITNTGGTATVFENSYGGSDRFALSRFSSSFRCAKYNGSSRVGQRSSSNIALPTGRTYITYTITSGNVSNLYINGTLNNAGTFTPSTLGSNLLSIGSRTNGTLPMGGSITTIGFYNKILTQEEITQIYNAGRNARSPIRDGLIAEYYIAPTIKTNLGNEVNAIDIDYNGQQLQNDLTIEYDTGTTTVADSASIALHGVYKKYIKDTSIKNTATATERGNAILQQNAYPKEQTKVVINRQYDIESIKPGQTISVLNTNEAVKEKTIQRIRYSIQGVELEVDEFDTIEKSVKKSLSS